jgi:hypothetical protein
VKDAASLIISQGRCIPDGEGVWPLDGHFAGFTPVEFFHSLHFGKGDTVSVFQTVPCLIQARDEAVLILQNNEES